MLGDSSKRYTVKYSDRIVMSDVMANDETRYNNTGGTDAEETKYDTKAYREYGYAIAKSNLSNKEIKYAYKNNKDDSFYRPSNDVFNKVAITGRTNADDLLTALLVVLGFVFAYCCIGVVFEVRCKKENIAALKKNGATGVYPYLLAIIPVVAVSLFISGASSLLSLLFVNGWNRGIKEQMLATTLHFGFVNFLFLFGVALLIIGAPTLISCLCIKSKKKAKRNIK